MANRALNQILIDAAKKAQLSHVAARSSRSSLKKLAAAVPLAPFDETLSEFYVPGRTRRGEATEEQKMIAALKALVGKLEAENKAFRAELPVAKEKTFQRGLEEGQKAGEKIGFERGKSESLAAMAKVQENIARVLKQLELKKESIFKGSERKLLEIALVAAEKVIERECSIQKDIVLNVVKKAIAEVSSADRLLIKVNPKELETVTADKDFWMPVHKALTDIRVESDSRVERGGCIVETASGSVDARPMVKLEKIREIFLRSWEEGTSTAGDPHEPHP